MSNKGSEGSGMQNGRLGSFSCVRGQRGRGVVVTERGPTLAAKGDPKMGVSAPVVALIVYPETSADPLFAT